MNHRVALGDLDPRFCEDLGHPYDRDDRMPDEERSCTFGRCWCGQRVYYPAWPVERRALLSVPEEALDDV